MNHKGCIETWSVLCAMSTGDRNTGLLWPFDQVVRVWLLVAGLVVVGLPCYTDCVKQIFFGPADLPQSS